MTGPAVFARPLAMAQRWIAGRSVVDLLPKYWQAINLRLVRRFA